MVDAADSSIEHSSSAKSRSAHHKSNSQSVKATTTTKPTGKRFSLKQMEKASQEENKKRKRQNPARDIDSKSFVVKEQESLPAPILGSDGKKSVAEEDKQKTDTSSAITEAWSVSHDFGEKTIPTTLATELIRPQQSGSYQFISGPFNTYETATWDREDQREREERRAPDEPTKRYFMYRSVYRSVLYVRYSFLLISNNFLDLSLLHWPLFDFLGPKSQNGTCFASCHFRAQKIIDFQGPTPSHLPS